MRQVQSGLSTVRSPSHVHLLANVALVLSAHQQVCGMGKKGRLLSAINHVFVLRTVMQC